MEQYKTFLDLCKARKTTYDFDTQKVSKHDVLKILEAGRWAPSCLNLQPWNFIIIKNKKTITKLMKYAYYGDFHTDPPVIIALVLRKECISEQAIGCAYNQKIAALESHLCLGMCAYSMLLEAADLSIASALLSPDPRVGTMLATRTGDFVPLLIGLGYEKTGVFQKIRERKQLRDLVHYEVFSKK